MFSMPTADDWIVRIEYVGGTVKKKGVSSNVDSDKASAIAVNDANSDMLRMTGKEHKPVDVAVKRRWHWKAHQISMRKAQ